MKRFSSIYLDSTPLPTVLISINERFPNNQKTVEVNSKFVVVQYYCEICEIEKERYLDSLKQSAKKDLAKALERCNRKEKRKKECSK